MTKDEALKVLTEVRAAMHKQFGAHHEARLDQLDASLGTVVMAVEHLHDEEAREVDLARRIMNRDTVHGADEVRSPVGRPVEQTRAIAGKAG